MLKNEFIYLYESKTPKQLANIMRPKLTQALLLCQQENAEHLHKKWTELYYFLKQDYYQCGYCGVKELKKKQFQRYCSLECSRKDPNKVSKEMVEQAQHKRNIWIKTSQEDTEYWNEHCMKAASARSANRADEERQKQSEFLKKRIQEGKFIPNVHSKRTHWEIEIDGKKFRSSFEAIFHLANKDFEYETLRIPYSYNNSIHTYIVDFVDNQNKICVEVKPSSHTDDEKVIAKENSLIDWCSKNGYSYAMITEVELKEMAKGISHPFMETFYRKYKTWI